VIVVGWLDDRPATFPMNWPLTVIGYRSFEHTTDPTAVGRIAAFLNAGLRSRVLKPVIDTVFRFDDVAEAHRHLDEASSVGQIVITV
jgi:NADPH:quinone reductase-like Zn-dependent oxidoreductase